MQKTTGRGGAFRRAIGKMPTGPGKSPDSGTTEQGPNTTSPKTDSTEKTGSYNMNDIAEQGYKISEAAFHDEISKLAKAGIFKKMIKTIKGVAGKAPGKAKNIGKKIDKGARY